MTTVQDDYGDAEPVGSILKAHLKHIDGPWCKEILLYSPDNQGDSPEHRVMLYTGGRLGDALEWAENGLSEWRSVALETAKNLKTEKAKNKIAMGHLQALLLSLTEDHLSIAKQSALDWLDSIE